MARLKINVLHLLKQRERAKRSVKIKSFINQFSVMHNQPATNNPKPEPRYVEFLWARRVRTFYPDKSHSDEDVYFEVGAAVEPTRSGFEVCIEDFYKGGELAPDGGPVRVTLEAAAGEPSIFSLEEISAIRAAAVARAFGFILQPGEQYDWIEEIEAEENEAEA